MGLQPRILSSIPGYGGWLDSTYLRVSTTALAAFFFPSSLVAADLIDPMDVKRFMQNLAFSVFPAPDSPDITIAWFFSLSNKDLYASAATA